METRVGTFITDGRTLYNILVCIYIIHGCLRGLFVNNISYFGIGLIAENIVTQHLVLGDLATHSFPMVIIILSRTYITHRCTFIYYKTYPGNIWMTTIRVHTRCTWWWWWYYYYERPAALCRRSGDFEVKLDRD